MKTFLLMIAICLLTAVAAFSQTVTITPKKVVYTRPEPMMEHKKEFTVTHPVVKAATPAITKKIEQAIDYKAVLGLDIKEEMDEIQWLEEADFEVKYNRNGILAIELRMYGTGAYPSGSAKTVVVDLATGIRVTPAQVFTNTAKLAAMINADLKKAIAKGIAEIRKDPDASDLDPKELFEGKRFTVDDLEGFSVGADGVTFTYNYGFPHVIKALEPDGTFVYSWEQLRPYIKRDGLLARISR